MAPEEKAHIDRIIKAMAVSAISWSDEEFAARAVGLLIQDEGNLNKYQRSLETVLKIFRETERLKAAPMVEAKQAALDLALALLIKHEPGDSRAVSDVFVAMADVAANEGYSQDSVTLIKEALAKEQNKG